MDTTQQPVAVVTGASRGIGLGVTQALLKRGWRVVGISRTISSSKDLRPSPELVLADGDVSKKETAIKVVDAAVKHFGRIDLLVNNAGIYMPKAFTDYTEEDYNLVMNTNVASFFYMTQQVIPQMKKQNSGHVVSISGFPWINRAAPRPNCWPYCRNRRCRLRVRRWLWNTRRTTSGSTRCLLPSLTRRCTLSVIMRSWRSFIPWLGWVKFLMSSTRCSISKAPRS